MDCGMQMIPFDLVGFDLDGTLLDTGRDLAIATNHAIGTIGRPPLPEEMVRRFVGSGARVMLGRALAADGVADEALIEQLIPVLLEYYIDHIAVHTAPYPGLIAVLDGLAARGVRLAVCTNKREYLARALFEKLGMTERFVSIVGGDTMGPGTLKPHPAPLAAMIERAGGGRAIFLGDTAADTSAAKAVGIPCIGCDFGFAEGNVDAIGADAVIRHYDELIPLLEGWEQRNS
jgi:phosphoglycolate phosphatase